MKIALYTDTYLPNIDGVVSQIVASKDELEKRGHEAYVFSSGTLSEKRANHDKTIFYHTAVKFPPYPQYKVALFPFKSTYTAHKLGVEIVHCHALATMGLAAINTSKLLRLPLVGTFHTMIPLSTHYLTSDRTTQAFLADVAWKAISAFYTPFDTITAPSNTIAKLLREHGVPNVKVIPNGVNLHKFNPQVKGRAEKRRALRIKPSEKLFTFVGRVTQEKNIDVAVKAAALALQEDPELKFAVIGDGPSLNGTKEQAADLGIASSFRFTGAVKHQEVPNYLAASDWQVTASTFETQGLSIIEGLACGKPCIGARSLAIPEAVQHGKNGFLFEEFNHEQLAELILKAANMSKKSYEKISTAATKSAEKYSIEKITDKFEETYQELL